MSAGYRFLLVEDSAEDASSIISALHVGGLNLHHRRVSAVVDLEAALREQSWDFIICDSDQRGFDGLAVLTLCHQMGLSIPFIMVSGRMGEDHRVEAFKAGAYEYVVKDNMARLVPAVNRELHAAQERQILKQVEATKDYLASVVESCNDAILGQTLEGTIVAWNAGAEQLYGYAASEMIGRSVSVLIPSYRPEELSEMLDKLRRGEPLEHFETVRIRKDGTAVEVSLAISPIKDGSGRIVGASSVARDITRSKQEEREQLNLIQDLTAALAKMVGHLEPAKAARN